VKNDLDELISSGVKVMATSILIGWIKKRREFIPSTRLFELAMEKGFKIGCAVVAKSQGVKAFLYGNDLLVSSVERFLHPIEKGVYVAVLDKEDMKVIGIGKFVINPEDFDRYVKEGKMLITVVENIFDLGIFLRDESYI
jgi:ribosome biogenesis protein Nip4